MELENRVGDAKGKGTKWKQHEAESTEALARGALPDSDHLNPYFFERTPKI
jgi:hypothetical protein